MRDWRKLWKTVNLQQFRNFSTKLYCLDSKFSSLAPSGARDSWVFLLQWRGKSECSWMRAFGAFYSNCLDSKTILKSSTFGNTLRSSVLENWQLSSACVFRAGFTGAPTKKTGVRNGLFCFSSFFVDLFLLHVRQWHWHDKYRGYFSTLYFKTLKFLRSRLRRSRRMNSFEAGGAAKS